jgi:hypothetical protein
MGEDGKEEEEEREGEGREVSKGCGFVCGSDRGMKKHGLTEHG